MINREFVAKLDELRSLTGRGSFEESYAGTISLLESIDGSEVKNAIYYGVLSNIAGNLIDVGMMQPKRAALEAGLKIMEENRDAIIPLIGEASFYYNLANAKSGLVAEKDYFKLTFENIEQLVDCKACLWKSIKASLSSDGVEKPEQIVNLGNSLKRQFRIVEALQCYDSVNKLNHDIPQSWINRSEALKLLNQVSGRYSIKMLEEIKRGYAAAVDSNEIPITWIPHYKRVVEYHSNLIASSRADLNISEDRHDETKTSEEYFSLSEFRRFCLENHLTLSEHALYCLCAGSAIDDLTIPADSIGISDFVPKMEMVLNRLKSEFSLARKLYFDFKTGVADFGIHSESGFSNLENDELLGIEIESLRASFKICFGILDKIAVAVCNLHSIKPKKGKIYFNTMWGFDNKERRESFEAVKNPGLLALYSIATDLDDGKDGELSFYKKWRNYLEHNFLVIHRSESKNDAYGSHDFGDDIIFIHEKEFMSHLDKMLQMTRSAIFSFVYSVREKNRSAMLSI